MLYAVSVCCCSVPFRKEHKITLTTKRKKSENCSPLSLSACINGYLYYSDTVRVLRHQWHASPRSGIIIYRMCFVEHDNMQDISVCYCMPDREPHT